jgi:PIN domain nuclease of toxin-antitoxin system
VTVPLLDTHAWVWWIDGDPRLTRSAKDFLDGLPVDSRPYLADISLWEVAMLVERGRLTFRVPLADWLEAAAHPRSVRLIPIAPAIAAEIAALPKTFHRDPADRVIVATCRTMGLPLVTRDRRILRSRLVRRWRPSPRSGSV